MIHNRQPLLVVIAAVSGFLAVMLGAFGAHVLKSMVTPAMLAVWHTAVQYQMFHTLALLAIGALPIGPCQRRRADLAGWLFVAGTLLFSGSLYALVLTGWGRLGAVTPLGGALLLGGWAALVLAIARRYRDGD